MEKYQLPWWMQWIQAVALILIPIIGAWLAFKQVRIAEAKLNLDLYEKRYAVFEGARRLLAAVIREGAVDLKEVAEYNVAVADAPFLFDKDIEIYLDDLRKRLSMLRMTDAQLRASGDDQERRSKLADREAELLAALANELETLTKKFRPYLKLGLLR